VAEPSAVPGKVEGAPAPATVAPQPAPGQSGAVSAPAPGVVPVPTSPAQYGGRPSGRPLTKFQFDANTPEGKEERRKADADRKAAARAVASQVAEPPPLPSALPRVGNSTPALNGVQILGVANPSEPAPVLWQPDTLNDLVGELLDAAEDNRVSNFVGRCQEAGLMGKLVKEIESDARFPKTAKLLFKRALPRLAAKWLNKAGISAENQDELELITALLLIVQHDRKTSKKLDELIDKVKEEKAKAAEAAAAAQKNPPLKFAQSPA